MIKITNLRFTPLPPYLLTTLFPYGPYNMASIPIKFLKLLFQKNSMTQKCTTHIPQEGSAAQLQEMWFAEHLQLMYLQDPPQPITEQGGNIISPQPGSLLTGCLCSSTPSFVKSISWVWQLLFPILLLFFFFFCRYFSTITLLYSVLVSASLRTQPATDTFWTGHSPQFLALRSLDHPFLSGFFFFGPMIYYFLSSSPSSTKVPLWDHLPPTSFSQYGHFPKPNFWALSSSFSLFSS